MLVLTRKVGERILITAGKDQIVISLEKIRGQGVAKLSIEAPKSIRILREEIKK